MDQNDTVGSLTKTGLSQYNRSSDASVVYFHSSFPMLAPFLTADPPCTDLISAPDTLQDSLKKILHSNVLFFGGGLPSVG